MEAPSAIFVCLMGIGTVFVGLISIIILTSIMGFVCNKFFKDKPTVVAENPVANPDVIENRQEIIAAVCAVIAEKTGTDMKNLKVLSFKKVD